MTGFWEFGATPNSALSSTTYYSLLCLLLLAGCGVTYSIVKEYARRRQRGVFWTPKERLIASANVVAEKASMVILGAILGMFAGIGYRDHQLVTNHVTYTDIDVLQKVNGVRYFVQPARMKTMDVTLCNDRVDWKPGDFLEDWTFEQVQGCKRVISYHKKQTGELNANLSLR